MLRRGIRAGRNITQIRSNFGFSGSPFPAGFLQVAVLQKNEPDPQLQHVDPIVGDTIHLPNNVYFSKENFRRGWNVIRIRSNYLFLGSSDLVVM